MSTEIFEDPSLGGSFQTVKCWPMPMPSGVTAGTFPGGAATDSAIFGGMLGSPGTNHIYPPNSVILMGNNINIYAGAGITGCFNSVLNGSDIGVCGINNTIVNGGNVTVGQGSWLTVMNGCNIAIAPGSSNNAYYVTVGGGCCQTACGCNLSLGTGQKNVIKQMSMSCDSCFVNIGGGAYNCVCGIYSSILGGCLNSIECSCFSFILAGCQNVSNLAGGVFSGIGGGGGSTVTANYSFIGGGCNQNILADESFIGGGCMNTVLSNGAYSAIVGGVNNSVTCACGFIGGGDSNNSAGTYGMLFGGYDNIVTDQYSVIYGGYGNCNNAGFSVIAGGRNNYICTSILGGFVCFSAIGGGDGNYITDGGGTPQPSNYSSIGGGKENYILNGQYSFLAGGCQNSINTDTGSFLGGGACNCINNGQYNVLFGGCCNYLNNSCIAGIIGGGCNCIDTSSFSVIGGGVCNYIYGLDNTCNTADIIFGGLMNCITSNSCNAMIGAGYLNVNDGCFASIGGGGGYFNCGAVTCALGNSIVVTNGSFIGGGTLNCIDRKGDWSVIMGGGGYCYSGGTPAFCNYGNYITGSANFIGGGQVGYIDACNSVVFGGFNNCIMDDCNAILGGSGNYIQSLCNYVGIFGCNISAATCCALHANTFVAASMVNGATSLPTAGSGIFYYCNIGGVKQVFIA